MSNIDDAVFTGPTDTLDAMTKDERSQLLYLESRAVDNRGRVAPEKMNAGDFLIVSEWTRRGFVRFSRLKSEYLGHGSTHAVELSDLAWQCAALERRRRAERSQDEGVRESLNHFEAIRRKQPTPSGPPKGRGGR